MGYTKDGGIDIIAIMKVLPDITIRMMVQCKKFALGKKVGVDIVKQIWADKWEKGFNEAMVVTTSSFTKGATQKAEIWNIVLKDHDAITNWCRQFGQIVEF